MLQYTESLFSFFFCPWRYEKKTLKSRILFLRKIEDFFCTGRAAKKARFRQKIYIWQAQWTSFLYTSWLQATEALDIMSSVGPLTPTATARSRAVVAVKTKDKDNDDSDEEDED